ncbi:MAG: transcription termination/antitermination protein NusG [Desulfobulbaceae bacterium A2]|nr:MAG: transcription termination/antitermination protein NusG [Desulfobulbaceae bacterium A2]
MSHKWYIVHVHTGFEDQVKASLLERIRSAGQVDMFGEIMVPTEQVVEVVKGGGRKTSARKFFPGYILVSMELNEATWHTVHGTTRVTGFVGDGMHPQPMTEEEAQKIIKRIQDGAHKPRPKISFEEGDAVRVVDGPFANFQGVVEEVYPDKGRVKVMVSIFGRSTPVELEFIQVSKA